MNTYVLFFSNDGAPRFLVRRALFHSNRTPRKLFRRAVIKKNGMVRPVFLPWVSRQAAGSDQGNAKADAAKNPLIAEAKHHDLLVLEKLRPLEENASDWKRATPPKAVLSESDVNALLQPVAKTWLVLSVGHDDYTTIPGGVQVCIQREQDLTKEAGGHYLNIHPWQPLPRMAHLEEDPDPLVVLVLDGGIPGFAGCRF